MGACNTIKLHDNCLSKYINIMLILFSPVFSLRRQENRRKECQETVWLSFVAIYVGFIDMNVCLWTFILL